MHFRNYFYFFSIYLSNIRTSGLNSSFRGYLLVNFGGGCVCFISVGF